MDLIHIHPSKEALAWKEPMKRLSILITSTIAASRCFGVWVDRCSSSLALHPYFWTFHNNNGKFFILPGSSENLSLPSMPVFHIRSCCPRKDLYTVYMFFTVYFEYNINIFYFVHFLTAVVETDCNQVGMGHEKKERVP